MASALRNPGGRGGEEERRRGLEAPGGHPGEVAEEESEDGSDEDDGEVAVPGLLGGAPLPQLVWV